MIEIFITYALAATMAYYLLTIVVNWMIKHGYLDGLKK